MKKILLRYLLLPAIILAVFLIVPKFYKNPPDKLLLQKYPEAKEISWTTIGDGSSASFTLNNKSFTAHYDNDIWEETTTEIRQDELPSILHFNHVIVWKVEKVENSKGETFFRVHIKPTKSYINSIYEYDIKGHNRKTER